MTKSLSLLRARCLLSHLVALLVYIVYIDCLFHSCILVHQWSECMGSSKILTYPRISASSKLLCASSSGLVPPLTPSTSLSESLTPTFTLKRPILRFDRIASVVELRRRLLAAERRCKRMRHANMLWKTRVILRCEVRKVEQLFLCWVIRQRNHTHVSRRSSSSSCQHTLMSEICSNEPNSYSHTGAVRNTMMLPIVKAVIKTAIYRLFHR